MTLAGAETLVRPDPRCGIGAERGEFERCGELDFAPERESALASESVEIHFAAVPASLARARATVGALAADRGARPEDLERIRLAVSEAVANVVMHAYGAARGEVHLTAVVIDGELTVVVADDGCGLGAAPASRGLGHGMRVIAAGCDSLSILRRSNGGTQLEMRFALDLACSRWVLPTG
ncbi:MAG TPA: ATP-binding protein [Solirubrobacteraceae bacterium]|jgi:anti-sigma regulatory factor (Ser/Thr protein kinase)|nr:ATP-binding protein [Solirubrobacteraceae bacterium]